MHMDALFRGVWQERLHPAGLRLGLLLVLAVCALLPLSREARACDGCECTGCVDCYISTETVSEIYKNMVTVLIETVLKPAVLHAISNFMQVWPPLANQITNNTQHVIDLEGVLSDRETAAFSATSEAQTRAENAVRLLPSRTACRVFTHARQSAQVLVMRATGDGPHGLYRTSQEAVNAYATNGVAATERGTLYAAQSVMKDIGDFCDPNVILPPSGFPCHDPGSDEMRFRYADPWRAVFGAQDGLIPPSPTDMKNRAARLFARMATEPVPPDPIRGPALQRVEGQNRAAQRWHDIAAVSLAWGALDHMVDDRIGEVPAGVDVFTDATAAENASLEYMRQKLWNNPTLTKDDVRDRAAQHYGANYDDLAPLVGEVNKVYWLLFNNLERLAALKAVHATREVQKLRAGGATLAGRVIQ